MTVLNALFPTLLCSFAKIATAQDAPKPDNTRVNKGDAKPGKPQDSVTATIPIRYMLAK